MGVLTFLSILFVLGICEARLKFFQATFRHGDRTPESNFEKYYPNDPYINETWYPEGFGGLNIRGKQRSFELGKFFKERYGTWLGDTYTSDIVTFYSSDVERTRMTALLLAAGLFPPNKNQTWNEFLNWQPIPVWSVNNNILFFGSLCPESLKLRAEVESTGRLLRRSVMLQPFFQRMSTYAGTNVTQRGVLVIYAQIKAQESSGKSVPSWIYQFGYPGGQIDEIAGFDYVIQSYNTAMKKYTGGQWISKWLSNVDNHLNGSLGAKKAVFYSGHEVNVAGILMTLNVFTPHVPSFCSSVIFELHELRGDYYVKLVYRNTDEVEELTIPKCKEVYCPLGKFRSIVADVLSDDRLACNSFITNMKRGRALVPQCII